LSLIEKIAAGPEQCFTDAIPTKAVKFIDLSTDRRKDNNQSINHIDVTYTSEDCPGTTAYLSLQKNLKRVKYTIMASVLAIGVGVAAAAFLVRPLLRVVPKTYLTSPREEQA
jgi:hypothetical protein